MGKFKLPFGERVEYFGLSFFLEEDNEKLFRRLLGSVMWTMNSRIDLIHWIENDKTGNTEDGRYLVKWYGEKRLPPPIWERIRAVFKWDWRRLGRLPNA